MTGGNTVTVFGGTGFLGRRVVRRLAGRGIAVRVASRHPERGSALFADLGRAVDPVAADIQDERSIAAALASADGAVNAVSLYVEKGRQTFHAVHVQGAARLARLAREAQLRRLVHVSGIGADAGSWSPYIRARGEGERAVRKVFGDAVMIRPSVMFGEDDAFLVPLARLVRRWPLFALFGHGITKLQPVHVEDVAEAIARSIEDEHPAPCYELGGPEIYTFRTLLKALARHVGRKPLLLPIPFGVWHPLAYLAERLPRPPITRNQVELMRHDNVASPDLSGFDALGMRPLSPEALMPEIVARA